MKRRKGTRERLNELEIDKTEPLFELTVEVPKIKIGKKQAIETLIKEEALLLAKFLSDKQVQWILRVASIKNN